MTGQLREQLMPLLDTARALFETLPSVEALPEGHRTIGEWKSQYSKAVDAIDKILWADHLAEMKRVGIESIVLVQRLTLYYEYFPDPLNDLHHIFCITVGGVFTKDSGRPLSCSDCVVKVRSIAQRFNARLAENRIPLFVFVELE